MQDLDLNGPGEPFVPQEEVDTASVASTESIHDDTGPNTKRSALEDATVTLPHPAAPTAANVDEPPVVSLALDQGPIHG